MQDPQPQIQNSIDPRESEESKMIVVDNWGQEMGFDPNADKNQLANKESDDDDSDDEFAAMMREHDNPYHKPHHHHGNCRGGN